MPGGILLFLMVKNIGGWWGLGDVGPGGMSGTPRGKSVRPPHQGARRHGGLISISLVVSHHDLQAHPGDGQSPLPCHGLALG